MMQRFAYPPKRNQPRKSLPPHHRHDSPGSQLHPFPPFDRESNLIFTERRISVSEILSMKSARLTVSPTATATGGTLVPPVPVLSLSLSRTVVLRKKPDAHLRDCDARLMWVPGGAVARERCGHISLFVSDTENVNSRCRKDGGVRSVLLVLKSHC